MIHVANLKFQSNRILSNSIKQTKWKNGISLPLFFSLTKLQHTTDPIRILFLLFAAPCYFSFLILCIYLTHNVALSLSPAHSLSSSSPSCVYLLLGAESACDFCVQHTAFKSTASRMSCCVCFFFSFRPSTLLPYRIRETLTVVQWCCCCYAHLRLYVFTTA